MSFGKNLQYLRRLSSGMTQEKLAEQLNVSRQTISKWEMDNALPEMDKAIELCKVFGCTLDNLFREELDIRDSEYSSLRTETVPSFRYIKYAVISRDPESDAIGKMRAAAKSLGINNPKIIGWDFPCLSQEQINVHHMHGYEAAWILPEGVSPENEPVYEQAPHKYAAIHIDKPFVNPFSTIPGAYGTLNEYMRLNGLTHAGNGVIPCFETDGDSMDVYIACE
ncbi:MAG: helix-turn-helix transcriptional regulator [Clostridia bacterium]|nr:helix-turn-helix transcriptional regulator [Clostridia bacterium]